MVNGRFNTGNVTLNYAGNAKIDSFINDLEFDYYAKKYQYRFGYIDFDHSNVLAPSGNIFGVAMIENQRMVNPNFYRAYKAPLSINLTQPYKVTIYSRGRKLFSEVLPQGESIINTQGFPDGVYDRY